MASLPLPIAGLMSPLPLEDLAPMMQKLNKELRNLGLIYQQPIGPILGLALPVIPNYSLSDMGLVDVARQVQVAQELRCYRGIQHSCSQGVAKR